MGYRSEVGLAIKKNLYEKILKIDQEGDWLDNPFNLRWTKKMYWDEG